MPKLPLTYFQKWLDAELIVTIDRERKNRQECQRQRKLTTATLLWLFIATALHAASPSLNCILRQAVADLGIPWTVSVAAFCKARARFSPRPLASPPSMPACQT